MNKPVSDTYVYYTTHDKKIRKVTLKSLLRKLNKVSFTKRWFQTIRQAQKSLD